MVQKKSNVEVNLIGIYQLWRRSELRYICALLQGCIFCPYLHLPEEGNFFKVFENSLPQASFFFFVLVKFGEGFQEGGGGFFQVFGRIYTPEIFQYSKQIRCYYMRYLIDTFPCSLCYKFVSQKLYFFKISIQVLLFQSQLLKMMSFNFHLRIFRDYLLQPTL